MDAMLKSLGRLFDPGRSEQPIYISHHYNSGWLLATSLTLYLYLPRVDGCYGRCSRAASVMSPVGEHWGDIFVCDIFTKQTRKPAGRCLVKETGQSISGLPDKQDCHHRARLHNSRWIRASIPRHSHASHCSSSTVALSKTRQHDYNCTSAPAYHRRRHNPCIVRLSRLSRTEDVRWATTGRTSHGYFSAVMYYYSYTRQTHSIASMYVAGLGRATCVQAVCKL